MRERGLIGRGTYILLFNPAGELCVHRRTLSKAIYPGYWDVAAGGMVQANESYAESAARELEEELGVAGVELRAHEHFFFDQPGNRLWCAVFSAVWDGPLRLQPEEVSEARFLPLAQALQDSQLKPYCPDSLAALNRFIAGHK
ncbi:putative Nudix hydrolase YfcD [compost metagenome]